MEMDNQAEQEFSNSDSQQAQEYNSQQEGEYSNSNGQEEEEEQFDSNNQQEQGQQCEEGEENCFAPVCFDAMGMVDQAKRNPHTLVGKKVCESDVVNVWNAISQYIMEQMCAGRPVKIQGMVTFTLKVMKIEISHSQIIVKRIPHVLVAGDLVQKCSLKVKRPAYNLDITETILNMSTIANILNISREKVQMCIDEVMSAYMRCLMTRPQVDFIFPNIGRLVSSCRQVDFVYNSKFLSLMGLNEEFILDKWCPVR